MLRKEEDGTYESFYYEPEYSITDPLDMLTIILKRILVAKAKSDVPTSREIFKRFFKDKYLYFPKMALYIIGQNTDTYEELFWEIFVTDVVNSIMENTLYFGDELKHLLKNLRNLTDEQKKTLNEKIETAAKRQATKEDPEKSIAIHKQEIYEALSHDQYFKNLYDEMKKITGWDVALHPAVGKVETRLGTGPSPLTKDDIIKMLNNRLAEFLANFKTEDLWRGPTVDGLTALISEVAKEMPEKFLNDMKPFKDTGFTYLYEILNGIRNAWNGKKNIDWNKLFVFVKPYINRKEFWEDKFIVEKDGWSRESNHHWIVGIVSDLIQDGTRDDGWAFSEEHSEKAKEIVFLLLDNLKDEEDKKITDYVTYSLNTPLGRTITAVILLALRMARVSSEKGIVSDIKWKPEFKKKYEEILNNKVIEGFVNLGYYLPNLYYLDKEWVKVKIKSIENEKGSNFWEAFMDGYLSIGKVYDEFYVLMRDHYQYGIGYNFKKKRDNEHLVQHIALGYFRKHESIYEEGCLFKQVLDKFEYNQIEDIIRYFWMQRGYIKEQAEVDKVISERIIDFWRWLYEKYKKKDSLNEEDKKILSNIAKLATILPQIDKENIDWLMLSAPYIHESFSSSFFIEYLDELKDKGDSKETAKYIGEIFLKMLEKFTPDYDQKHIRSIVEFLCNNGAKESGKKICNIYGSREQYFLKDIHDKCADKQ